MKAYSIKFAKLQEKYLSKNTWKLRITLFSKFSSSSGIAFAVFHKLDPYLRRFCSDRIGVADFYLPTSKEAKSGGVFIIVAYTCIPGCAEKTHKHVTTTTIRRLYRGTCWR